MSGVAVKRQYREEPFPSVLEIAGNQKIIWTPTGANIFTPPNYLPQNTAVSSKGGSNSYVYMYFTSQNIDCSKYSKLIMNGELRLFRGYGHQWTELHFSAWLPNESLIATLDKKEYGEFSVPISREIDITNVDTLHFQFMSLTGDVDAWTQFKFSTLRLEK